jgi:acyl-CoA synthetase (AMP-forming)/AMP-acid ligase II
MAPAISVTKTRFCAVPTIFIRLLNNPESKRHLSSLTYCFSAVTGMASEIVSQWQESFKLKIYEAYGMTEISGGKDIKADHSQILG